MSLRQFERSNLFQHLWTETDSAAAYVNRDWKEDGIASIFVLRRVKGERILLMSYLIDTLCTGLKGVTGRLDLDDENIGTEFFSLATIGTDLTRIDVQEARRLVWAGVLFGERNGFRLPPLHRTWLLMLGSQPDEADAMMKEFGADGKLIYIGTKEGLAKRLVQGSAEAFLARSDVEFENEEGNPFIEDDTDNMAGEAVAMLSEGVINGVRRWCFANGAAPSDRLPEAVELFLESAVTSMESADEIFEPENCAGELQQMLDGVLSLFEPQDEVDIRGGMGQLSGFMQQFETPRDMFESCGVDLDKLPWPDDEEWEDDLQMMDDDELDALEEDDEDDDEDDDAWR